MLDMEDSLVKKVEAYAGSDSESVERKNQ